MSGEYLLFAGRSYYPAGGWGDFISAHETLEEAKAVVIATHRHERRVWPGYSQPTWRAVGPYDWAHIVHDGSIVSVFFPSDEPGAQADGWYLADGWTDA